ncbi:MAG: polysaccharide deacetylase family protein [Verrucomicrobiae bacterium]|nr:polysaccharide deacetylase family protein [Verrucomicrobiae bacterium]
MPKPRYSRVIRIGSDIALGAGLILFLSVSPVLGIAVSLVSIHLLILWGQLSPYSQWLGPVVTRFRLWNDRQEIWLTIDDGPDPDETPAVLDVLDRFNARATFFVIGQKVHAHPELVREIVRRGHQVASHTWSHPQYSFWALPAGKVRDEIDRGRDALRRALEDLPEKPKPTPIFRSPVGMKAFSLLPLLEKRHLHLVAWTARGRDGAPNPDLDRVFERLRDGVEPGAILVLHEGRGHAPALLERLLKWTQDAGFTCVIPSTDRLLADGKPVTSASASGERR